MFNVAIVNIKDIVKYLVSLIFAITIVVLLTRYFFNSEQKEKIDRGLSEKISNIGNQNFLVCIDTTIPIIESAGKQNTETANAEESTEDVLQKIIDVELGMMKVKEYALKEETNQEYKEQKEENVALAEDNVNTEVVTKNPIALTSTNEYNGIKIKNESDKVLTDEILNPNITIENKNITIFHTHTCESYTSSEEYSYVPTGTYRTTDHKYSVVRVGEELTKYLKEYQYSVMHDTTYHDYPSYTGSYSRSLKTVEGILKNNSSDIVVDLHRDAIGSKSDYAPTVKIGEEYAAQLMFVIGTDGGGLWHPNWNQNLKFAIKVQQKAEEMYPNLFKPIILRNSRYNQQTAKAACIIEVGATGNTLEQCLTSMKYLSSVLNEVLK